MKTHGSPGAEFVGYAAGVLPDALAKKATTTAKKSTEKKSAVKKASRKKA